VCALGTIALAVLPAVGCVDLTRPEPIVTGMQGAGGSIGPDAGMGGFDEDASGPMETFADLTPEAPAGKDTAGDRPGDTPMQLRSGLVAYWPLDEGIGNYVEDKTGYANHGSALNGPAWVNRGMPAALVGDRAALRFDGVNDYAILGASGIPPNDAARTVSLWVNIQSASPSQHFITLSNGYSSGLEIGLRAGVLAAMGWNGFLVMNAPAPTRDVWHHIVHTYEAGQNKLYVDGALGAMATATKGAAPTSEVWLASFRGRDLFFGGQLDDIRIYDRALTSAEITTLYSGAAAVIDPAPAKPTAAIPDLVGYWKMDETVAGTILADSSGQGSTGIPVNRPAPADPMRNVVFPNTHSLSFYTNQCAYLTNSGVLNFTGAITISAWIYPTVQSGLRQVFGHGPADAETGLRLDNGSYAIYSMNATTHTASFPIPLDDVANWIHLAGTYDGTMWRLYRNGRQVADTVDSTGAVSVNGNWGIAGTGACDARFFQGNIDDLRLYKRGLTADEIRRIARGEL
jgi:hypothetical protein